MSYYSRTKSFLKYFLAKGSDVRFELDAISSAFAELNTGLLNAIDGLSSVDIQNNYSAGAAPTVNDDSGDGYAVSSKWYDTTNNKAYVCLDPSAGAAVWREFGGTGTTVVGKQTIWVPATAMSPTLSNGCSSLVSVETTAGRPDLQVLDFDASSDEHAQFSVAFPKGWDESTVTFQPFWTSSATDTDGVTWALQGVAVSDGDTIDVAYGTAVTVDDACQSTAEDLYVGAESGDMTIAGSPAAGDLCYFRIFRDVSDANDTAAEDARLIGIKLLFTTDSPIDD